MLYVALSEKSPVRLLGLGGCVDEAVYAWLINVAAAHFNAVATSKGRDIENLMTGVQEQTKLWTKMQKPLFVQATLMILGLVYQAYGLKINALIRALLMMIRGCAKPMGEEALGPSASMFQRVLAALDQSLAAATPS